MLKWFEYVEGNEAVERRSGWFKWIFPLCVLLCVQVPALAAARSIYKHSVDHLLWFDSTDSYPLRVVEISISFVPKSVCNAMTHFLNERMKVLANGNRIISELLGGITNKQ